MSNVNTTSGFYKIPQIVVTATSEQALLVPASGYPGLPSPTLPSGAGITIAPSPDITGSVLDGRPFRVRAVGVASTLGSASTIIAKLRQVNAVAVGVIGAAGSVTTAGVPGTGTNLFATSATIGSSNVASVQFEYEYTMFWDSTSKNLTGFKSVDYSNFTSTNVLTTPAVGTPIASLNFADLNFMLSFTFSAANAANTINVNEFSIERV